MPNGIVSALRWLESQQQPPVIVAPPSLESSGYRLSVPNNAMDIVAGAWSRGNESSSGDADERTHRTMKAVRSILMRSEAVHYLWPVPNALTDEARNHVQTLSEVASSVAALGWGIDMAVGHGSLISAQQAEALAGERWLSFGEALENGLRVPVDGTLKQLMYKHTRFLLRVGPEGFSAPPPLTTFRKINYRRATDPVPRPLAAFALLKSDASGYRAFDPARKGLTVAGMMRGLTRAVATRSGWPQSKIDTFILGHGKSGPVGGQRFAYVPLPSIEARGEHGRIAGSVRRMMLTTFSDGCDAEIAWARRSLSGQELVKESTKEPAAVLSLIPESEQMVRSYTHSATTWSTITPMVLPGFDDPRHYRRRMKAAVGCEEQKDLLGRLDERIEGLIRKAIVQAGFPEALAKHATVEWCKVGFWPGAELADRYGVPDHLKRFPRLHVRIQWRDGHGPVQIPGPICFGGGRFYGLGLFAPI